MTKVLICVDGKSYLELGDGRFDAVMDKVGITLKKDSRSVLKWSEVYWSFRSYGMDVRMMEGSVPDDMDDHTLRMKLKMILGEGLKPIIFMYIDRKEEE